MFNFINKRSKNKSGLFVNSNPEERQHTDDTRQLWSSITIKDYQQEFKHKIKFSKVGKTCVNNALDNLWLETLRAITRNDAIANYEIDDIVEAGIFAMIILLMNEQISMGSTRLNTVVIIGESIEGAKIIQKVIKDFYQNVESIPNYALKPIEKVYEQLKLFDIDVILLADEYIKRSMNITVPFNECKHRLLPPSAWQNIIEKTDSNVNTDLINHMIALGGIAVYNELISVGSGIDDLSDLQWRIKECVDKSSEPQLMLQVIAISILTECIPRANGKSCWGRIPNESWVAVDSDTLEVVIRQAVKGLRGDVICQNRSQATFERTCKVMTSYIGLLSVMLHLELDACCNAGRCVCNDSWYGECMANQAKETKATVTSEYGGYITYATTYSEATMVISHVWAQQLLIKDPVGVLRHIKKIFKNQHCLDIDKSNKVWVDYLCNEAFNATKCGNLYSELPVYIIDKNAMAQENTHDAVIAMMLSDWYGRGWTHQEASNAKELVLISSNDAIILKKSGAWINQPKLSKNYITEITREFVIMSNVFHTLESLKARFWRKQDDIAKCLAIYCKVNATTWAELYSARSDLAILIGYSEGGTEYGECWQPHKLLYSADYIYGSVAGMDMNACISIRSTDIQGVISVGKTWITARSRHGVSETIITTTSQLLENREKPIIYTMNIKLGKLKRYVQIEIVPDWLSYEVYGDIVMHKVRIINKDSFRVAQGVGLQQNIMEIKLAGNFNTN